MPAADDVLTTERVRLRRFIPGDIELLVELDSDPEVMRYLTGGPPTPREVLEHDHLPWYIEYYDTHPGFGFWPAFERVSDEFLGWFHLRPDQGVPLDEPELGYRLRRAAWGRGFASEVSQALVDRAFTDLGAERVTAATYVDNLGSRRVMEKVGMRLVRTFRMTPEELSRHGVDDPSVFPGDDVEYAITRAEWSARQA